MARERGGAAGAVARPRRPALAFAAVAVLLASCGEPSPTSPAPASSVSGAPYRVVPLDPARTGRIEGRCTLERAVAPVDIRPGMGVDGPLPSESVNPGADQALAGCVVFLAVIAEGKDWPADMLSADRTAWIRILPGRYEPRVQWTRLDTQLAFESRISMDIAVHGFQGAARRDTLFNVSAQPGAKLLDAADLYLRRPGVVFVSDDFRGGFQAYVHVSPHPYVDVTRADASRERPAGAYRLEDVPAGAYELVCWHEGLEPVITGDPRRPAYGPGPEIRLTRPVRVAAGAVTEVEFVLPVSAAPPR